MAAAHIPADGHRPGPPPRQGSSRHEGWAAPHPDADDDRDASARMRLAALMLRRGVDVTDIALATEVPVALLEMLRDERATDPATLDRQFRATVDGARRRRGVAACVLVMEVAAVANIVVGLTALIGHLAGLGLLATLFASALIVAVYAVAHYSAPRAHRHHPRSAARGGRGFRE